MNTSLFLRLFLMHIIDIDIDTATTANIDNTIATITPIGNFFFDFAFSLIIDI